MACVTYARIVLRYNPFNPVRHLRDWLVILSQHLFLFHPPLYLSSTYFLLHLAHSSSSSSVPPISRSMCTILSLSSLAAALVSVAATISFPASDAEKQRVPSGASVALPEKADSQVLDEAMVAGGFDRRGSERGGREVK